MSADPFAPLVRKQQLISRVRAAQRRCLRPLRPSRIVPRRAGPPNLLVLAVDTLRYDHLGFAGYRRSTSPGLDDLAAAGVCFTDVTAAAPWTLPSFASALTGLMPGLHAARLTGASRNMDTQPPTRLAVSATTLAAHLRDQGYATAAFFGNPFFAFGLAETFDHHEYHNLAAPHLAATALEWIRRHADRPFFCFVLLNDPHEPTTPPPRDLAAYRDDLVHKGITAGDRQWRSLARWGSETAGSVHLGHAPLPLTADYEHALALKRAIYDATVRQVDRTIGHVVQQIAAWHLADNTVTTLFADHGEEFLDHLADALRWDHDPRQIRGIGHGQSHFQELLHVPWLAVGPGIPSGTRYDAPVSLCDFTPTVIDWLGVEALPLPKAAVAGMVGRSLASDTAAAGGASRFILAEAIAYGPDLVAVRQGKWKLIATRSGQPLGLYDLRADPGELTDLSATAAEPLRRLSDHLTSWRKASTDGGTAASWDDLSGTVRQRLKDLGYSE